MPPRRSTRSAAAPSRSMSTRRRRDEEEDHEEEEDEEIQEVGDDDDDDDEDAAPVRRGARRQSKRTASSSQVVATSSQRKVSSSSRRRRAADQDEDEDEEEEEEEEEEDDEDGDVTVTGSRQKGRKSIGSARDADEDSEDDSNVAAKWKMLERAQSGEITKIVRKAAKEIGKEEVLKKSADLCRLALYHEYSKGALRRPAINQHIFNNDSKAARGFPMVLRYCNKTLRGTFGMELVELKAGGSAYILRNVLPAAAIAGLTKPSKELAEVVASASKPRKRSRNSGGESAAQAAEVAGANARKNFVGQRMYDPQAPPLDWKAADGQLASMGLLYVILALILTNGRSLPNAQLRSHLRRLCLPPGEPLPTALRVDGNLDANAPFPARSNLISSAPRSSATEANNATIDSFLANAVKMHYLEHAKSSTLAGGTQAGAEPSGRSRASGDGEGGGEAEAAFDWKWGPRAIIEVTESGIAQFVTEIWGLGATQDDDEEEAAASQLQAIEEEADDDEEEGGSSSRRRAAAAKKKKGTATQRTAEQVKDRQTRILRDIERAAGSQLTQ
ncbi:hypothetical protein CF326_g6636 [Tilletia indica]|nr:hypothetical protein CF326_g6636 [Tilletia indica]